MKIRGIYKLLSVFFVIILVAINLNGFYFVTSQDSTKSRGTQPYNSFRNYIWGGSGEEDDSKYGWNITYIKNLNNDAYPDLVVGTPWFDSSSTDIGAVYIFYGAANTGFDDINYSQADVTIRGDGLGFKFGWDVAYAGDINNDGIDDLIVGAPGALNNRGRAYLFYGGNIPDGISIASTIADRILDGPTANGFYGTSVAGIGDINKDGYGDVLVGAPGIDQAIITYGYLNKIRFYPNIWDDDTILSDIRFNNGLNNTPSDLNTWGINGADDGWDWTDNIADPSDLYGGDGSNDGATLYAPFESDGPDADGLTYANRTSLEITVGRDHFAANNPYGSWGNNNPGGSAAWGIKFEITTEMYNYLSLNSTIKVSFDYWAEDAEGFFSGSDDTEEWCSIRSRIWNGSRAVDRHYIGYIGDPNDLYVTLNRGNNGNPWGPISEHFQYDITKFIDRADSYYWDFGCYLGYGRFGDTEGMIAFFDNISMQIVNERSVIIRGMTNSGFGSAVEGVGDIDGDGYPDMMIGAPLKGGGHVAFVFGQKKFRLVESANIARIILTGKNDDDRFGHSVSLAGDVDNDGLQDIIIGAPGGNYANLYFRSTLKKPAFVPDLWEATEDISTPWLEFTNGVKSTGNTPGPTDTDDGWDSWNGVYGSSGGSGPGSSTRFNGEDVINAGEIANDDQLIISIGARYGNSAEPDSGAYGVKFQVTSEMIKAINKGADAVVSYDWEFYNVGLDDGDDIWIKTFIRNSTADHDLGWDLDGKGDENEVHWAQSPENIVDVFVGECADSFQNVGKFYFDLGGKVESWESSQWNREDGHFYFDNVHLRINQPPDVRFYGEAGSGFGTSVGYCEKLNFDDYGDIIIGAPYYDSPNGVDSGAIYGFFNKLCTGQIKFGRNAEYITHGEQAGDNFGWALSESISLDSDDFAEVVTSAVNFDKGTNTNIGRIYFLSITRIPRIWLLHPLGGELLYGNLTVNATVIDPDNNVDNTHGVRFYYSNDLTNWIEFGRDITPETVDNIYDHFWNTTTLPDGTNYYVRAWVRDLELNIGENISSALTIDNPHEPEISIDDPKIGETIAGMIEIKAKAKDSELDTIGGGINTTEGVKFYFSEDQETWEVLGSKDKGVQNIYSMELDTLQYPDGEYWIKVNASDWDGLEVEDIINISIDNPGRAPNITFLSPITSVEISGNTKISARAFDFDGDINSSGVTFYISQELSTDERDWLYIGNDPEPQINETGAHIYSIIWDTTTVADDWYYVKAFVRDSEDLTNESYSPEIKVHNQAENPPFIQLVTPAGGITVKETQIITAYVRDLEGNIDTHGVDYYYSVDKVKWKYIGTTVDPRLANSVYYDFLWQTTTVPDGEYWINVSVSDETKLNSWDIIDKPIFIHNSGSNPPIIKFIEPKRGQHINGTFTIQVSALDLENNIDTVGVIFYYSSDGEDFNVLSNVASPTTSGGSTYEFQWDTTKHLDGKYWLKAEANDFDENKGEEISDYFFIHNQLGNAPVVTFLSPNSGNLSGTVKLNATVFDLENNLDNNGVKFYYSSDGETWQLISSDVIGNLLDDESLYFEINWDTTKVDDDIYWLKAEATDITSLLGSDLSDQQVIVHNKMDNPPRIIFRQPNKDIPLARLESIVVEVIDFENDVESVTFMYTKDNKTWVIIDTRYKAEKGNLFRQVWNTEEITNGFYFIKVIAKDKVGNQAEITEGPFEVTEGTEPKAASSTEELPYWWIIIIVIIVVVMLLVIMLVMKRSKKREKELIEEVSAEVRESMAREGEAPIEPMAGVAQAGLAADTLQTYLPPSEAPIPEIPEYEADVETIESYKAQMESWKAEGYNVSRLEQQLAIDEQVFARTFPIFSSNITRLKDISSKLNSIDTTGHEVEVSSIKVKLFEPDQAMATEQEFKNLEQKLGLVPAELGGTTPGVGETPALGTPPTGAGTIPELPPIDDMLPQLLPAGETQVAQPEQPGIPESPFAGAQTQTLEEEMGAPPPDVELPPDIGLPPEAGEAPIPGQEPKPEGEKKEEEK